TNVLPQGKTTVDKYTGHRLVSLELRDQSIGCGIKLRLVFFCPPIIKVSIAIVLRSRIVKTMRQFVAYYRANTPKIDGSICLILVKWRQIGRASCREREEE